MKMAKFVSKGKLSKKAQKELNRQRRVTWEFSPVTKTVESRKVYSRKRKIRNRDEYGPDFFMPGEPAPRPWFPGTFFSFSMKAQSMI